MQFNDNFISLPPHASRSLEAQTAAPVSIAEFRRMLQIKTIGDLYEG
jgi:hypothetical protein